MIELAKHIVQTNSGHFDPEKFEDRYESALRELLKKKQASEEIRPEKEREPSKVINLMNALRRSVKAETGARGAEHKRAAASRRSSSKKTARSATKDRSAA